MSNQWLLECTEITRALVGDMSDTPTYSDDRLAKLLIVAAGQVVQEVTFDTIYSINIQTQTIAPDPGTDSTRDNAFMNLLSLKAAVILMDSEARVYSMSAIRVQDGPSSIDTSQRATFVKDAAKALNDKYLQMKMLFQMGEAGAAILTPTTVPHIYPITRFQ